MYVWEHQLNAVLVTIVQSPVKTKSTIQKQVAKMWLIILQDEQGAVFCISFPVDSIFTVK